MDSAFVVANSISFENLEFEGPNVLYQESLIRLLGNLTEAKMDIRIEMMKIDVNEATRLLNFEIFLDNLRNWFKVRQKDVEIDKLLIKFD